MWPSTVWWFHQKLPSNLQADPHFPLPPSLCRLFPHKRTTKQSGCSAISPSPRRFLQPPGTALAPKTMATEYMINRFKRRGGVHGTQGGGGEGPTPAAPCVGCVVQPAPNKMASRQPGGAHQHPISVNSWPNLEERIWNAGTKIHFFVSCEMCDAELAILQPHLLAARRDFREYKYSSGQTNVCGSCEFG